MTSSAAERGPVTTPSGPRIDGERLLARIRRLAAITDGRHGGVTRPAYSPQDAEARNLVARWLSEAGLAVRTDQAGNLFGRLPGSGGRRAALVTGSHLDTVMEAGPLDGTYGVLAAIEAADALRSAGLRLGHDLVVAAFSNEEGARGTPGMTGSKAVAGLITAADLARADDEGVTLAARIAAGGGDPGRLGEAVWDAADVAAFLELHIEQGPVLEGLRRRIGVVTAITGQAKADITITGQANHAGTTPMCERHDAAVAAAHLVLAVQSLAADGHVQTATTGVVRTGPGVRNIVPGRAVLGVDVRDTEQHRITGALERLADAARAVAQLTGTTVELCPGPVIAPVPADPWLAGCVAAAAGELGVPPHSLHSGAGHDAQIMARLAPTAMIFIPSTGGLSHCPQEASTPDDLVLGADTLLRALIRADRTAPA